MLTIPVSHTISVYIQHIGIPRAVCHRAHVVVTRETQDGTHKESDVQRAGGCSETAKCGHPTPIPASVLTSLGIGEFQGHAFSLAESTADNLSKKTHDPLHQITSMGSQNNSMRSEE